MMESVDMADLKSAGHRPCGFDSRRPHQQEWHLAAQNWACTGDLLLDIVVTENR